MEQFERVAVLGLGYIGLPTSALLASCGLKVLGIDIKQDVVKTINRGEVHIVEKDLSDLIREVVTAGRLKATTSVEPAAAFIIAVPTPFKENHAPELCYVESAVESIIPHLRKGNLVILESTSPVGTTENISKWMGEKRRDLTFPHAAGEKADVQVAYCPERVMPGQILKELRENDRVIGGLTPRCGRRAQDLYRIFVKGDCVLTSARTAEMVKLTENSFRDVNIAFANELSLICEKLQIDVWELIALANRHPRVKVLRPGPGVGGHCIAVDPWFIVDLAPEEARLIRTAREVNDSKPHFVVRKVKEKAKGLKNPVIACLGLSYKSDVDDLRESPSVHIVEILASERMGTILAVEPHISKLPERLKTLGVEFVNAEEALRRADAVLLLVDHKAFLKIKPESLKDKIVIDTRGVWR